MSTTSENKKRKLGSSSAIKGRPPPQKKFKRSTYHSDSEDDEEQNVTARDAPKVERKIEKGTEANATPVSAVKGARSTGKQNKNKSLEARKDGNGVRNIQQQISAVNGKDDSNKAEDEEGEDDDDANENPSDPEPDNTNPSNETTDSDSNADTNSESDSASPTPSSINSSRAKPKRHDPAAFATSISAILGSTLSKSKRSDPVLSRSKTAAEVSKALSESKLEARAKKQIVAERRLAKEKGRIRDVVIGERKAVVNGSAGGDGGATSAAEVLMLEKRLRKTAQRGVVHLFNAVRAAQVRGEEEARKVKAQGVVGMENRENRVKEMSRNAFLDLVGAGGEKR